MIGVAISALLHALGPVLHGWAMPLPLFIPIALLYVGFIAGLVRNIAWLAYIVLACMVVGGIGSLYEIYRISPVSDVLLWGIAIADFTAAIALITSLRS